MGGGEVGKDDGEGPFPQRAGQASCSVPGGVAQLRTGAGPGAPNRPLPPTACPRHRRAERFCLHGGGGGGDDDSILWR